MPKVSQAAPVEEYSGSLVITGLPGSGKTRVIQSLPKELTRPGCFESQDLLDLDQLVLPYQTLCVIDVRSKLVNGRDDWLEQRLKGLLASSNGIVFSFLEGAGLDDQAWWNKWVALNAGHLPIVRWLNQSFPPNWKGFEPLGRVSKTAVSDTAKAVLPLQTYEFEVGRICWEHLLFGLDSSKQNLGMKIARVKGMVQTLEYANKVEIEGSATRWELFAANEQALVGSLMGKVKIQGLDLDPAWLSEIVKASLV